MRILENASGDVIITPYPGRIASLIISDDTIFNGRAACDDC
jgi:hypothetical protein